ncbi:MAG TPA: CHRD domain-containing protein, partial [Bradyrhizobium sp.]|nr:CHRD domain-containing protein [Bradyrhizobium sp.]
MIVPRHADLAGNVVVTCRELEAGGGGGGGGAAGGGGGGAGGGGDNG